MKTNHLHSSQHAGSEHLAERVPDHEKVAKEEQHHEHDNHEAESHTDHQPHHEH